MKTAVKVATLGGLALAIMLMAGTYDKRKDTLDSLRKQLSDLQGQLSQMQSTYATDEATLQQQQQLQARIADLQQQVNAEIQKDSQTAALLQQAQQQQQQIQTLQAQIATLMVQLQQAALKQGPGTDANPDGYNQAQLAYLQSHPNLLPAGQIIAAQGGKLMVNASGTDGGPIVPNIIGANPTYGDPGFIVGDHWYPNVQMAQAASQSTGMPWNAAEIVDPSRFRPYEVIQSGSTYHTPSGNSQNANRDIPDINAAQNGIQMASQQEVNQQLNWARQQLSSGYFNQNQYNNYTYDITHQVANVGGQLVHLNSSNDRNSNNGNNNSSNPHQMTSSEWQRQENFLRTAGASQSTINAEKRFYGQ